ncbi:hypothetical protein [Brachybacterium huguangmaarense]
MTNRCDQCGRKFRGEGNHTPTRILCDDCNATYMGHAAGLIAGGGIGNAISTAGWYQRIRKVTKPKH